MNAQELRYFNLVRLNPGCTIAEVAVMMETPNATVWYMLNKLITRGYLRKERFKNDNKRMEDRYYCGDISQAEQWVKEATGQTVECNSASYEPVILEYLKEHSGASLKEIKEALNMHDTTLRNNVYRLLNKKAVINIGDNTKMLLCINDTPKVEEPKKEKKELSPREMILNLKGLGFTGLLNFTKEETLEFESLSIEQLKKYLDDGFKGTLTISKTYNINIEKFN